MNKTVKQTIRRFIGVLTLWMIFIALGFGQSGIRQFDYEKGKVGGVVNIQINITNSQGKTIIQDDEPNDIVIDLNDLSLKQLKEPLFLTIRYSGLQLGLKTSNYKTIKQKGHKFFNLVVPKDEKHMSSMKGMTLRSSKTINVYTTIEPENMQSAYVQYQINTLIEEMINSKAHLNFIIYEGDGGRKWEANIRRGTRSILYTIIPNKEFIEVNKRSKEAQLKLETINSLSSCSDIFLSECREYLNLFGDLNKATSSKIVEVIKNCQPAAIASNPEMELFNEFTKIYVEDNDIERAIDKSRMYVQEYAMINPSNYKSILNFLCENLQEGTEKEEIKGKLVRLTGRDCSSPKRKRGNNSTGGGTLNSSASFLAEAEDTVTAPPLEQGFRPDYDAEYIRPTGELILESNAIIIKNVKNGTPPYEVLLYTEETFAKGKNDQSSAQSEFFKSAYFKWWHKDLNSCSEGKYYVVVQDDDRTLIAVSKEPFYFTPSIDLTFLYLVLSAGVFYAFYFLYKKYFSI